MKKYFFSFAAVLLAMLILFPTQESLAASCSGTCYPTICPVGTTSGTGTCTSSDYVCCSGTATNYVGTGTTTSGTTSSGGGITLPTGTGLSSSTIAAILAGLLKWLLAIFGFLAIMSFIITGIMYLTSTGDDARQEKAKNQMMWSILGVIVGLSGYVAVQAITSWMSGGSQF